MMVHTWTGVLQDSFQGLWQGVIMYIPNIVVALIIVLIGWAIGMLLDKAIMRFFKLVNFDEALRRVGLDRLVRRSGNELNSGAFVGGLVKFFVIVAFLVAACDVLGLTQVTAFLSQIVLGYLPELIISVLILLVGAVVGDVVGRIVTGSAKTASVTSAHLLGKVAKWAVWIFAILVALSQMGIAAAFIQTIFTGFVVALSLALGLSFGLGGQQAASDTIQKIRSEIAHRQ